MSIRHWGIRAGLVAALVVTSLCLLAAATSIAVAGSHQGTRTSAKPGKPAAKKPAGTITSAKTTFIWGKAARATRYEVRVYNSSAQLLKKTAITKLSWKSTAALPRVSPLIWKVRGSNTAGAGPWSTSLAFQIAVAPTLAVGDAYGGGKVAYVLRSTDRGYDPNIQHGLIAATADQSAGIQWATEPYWNTAVPGGTGTAIGTGSANTDKIIAQNGAGTTYAAGLARAYTGGGYSDWYLPSKAELNKLYLNRVAIGGFDTTTYPWYWSSSEVESYVEVAWLQGFVVGDQMTFSEGDTDRVRAVRAF